MTYVGTDLINMGFCVAKPRTIQQLPLRFGGTRQAALASRPENQPELAGHS